MYKQAKQKYESLGKESRCTSRQNSIDSFVLERWVRLSVSTTVKSDKQLDRVGLD